jgi:TRAP-type mannitol/chloroaromatic compound transport system permease small subunit
VLEGSPDPGGLPRYPIKTMLLVSFALLWLQGIAEVIRCIATLRGRKPTRADDAQDDDSWEGV